MDKDKALHYVKTIPDMIKAGIASAKGVFDENGEKAFENFGSVAGLIVKIYGKVWVDKYFANKKAKKLEGFGFATYVQAAYSQAEKSLKTIDEELPQECSEKDVVAALVEGLEAQEQEFDEDTLYLIFTPKLHPGVRFVRDGYEKILEYVGTTEDVVANFLKDFNENIESEIRAAFGDDYHDHQDEVDKDWLKENETRLLCDMCELGRIGFAEDEDLTYETTYARWMPVGRVQSEEPEETNTLLVEDVILKQVKEVEDSLSEIETLVAEYFPEDEESIQKVLFVVADFGKGKSVFLRNYASQLAGKYLLTGDGLFPVYFNLRDFGITDYARETPLGVVGNFLEMKYGIKITEEYFKKKRYVFLLDSLDESGELTQRHIDSVIDSIKRIQQLDTRTCRHNRIIITSRPIDEGLSRHLTGHEPQTDKVDGKEEHYYLSIYGFKKEQFNHWLSTTLRNDPEFETLEGRGFAGELVESIKEGDDSDVYGQLVKNGTLS